MREFILDLHRIPDRVQAAMHVDMVAIRHGIRDTFAAMPVKPRLTWLGGWRSASEFLSPKLWERFVLAVLHPGAVRGGARRGRHSGASTSTPTGRATSNASRSSRKGKCVLVPRRRDRHLQGQGSPGRPHVPAWVTCRRALLTLADARRSVRVLPSRLIRGGWPGGLHPRAGVRRARRTPSPRTCRR